MKRTNLDGISEYRLGAEWYSHPSARVWKEILYPRILGNILSGLRNSTSEDSRAQLQGALIITQEINEALSTAEKNVLSLSARAEANQSQL